MTVKTPEAKVPTKPTPTPVAAAKTPKTAPTEKAVEKKARPSKSEFVDVTINVYGLEPYHCSGKRATAMKAARAWIRQRGLSVRLEGVERELRPDPQSAGANEFITYTFGEAMLQALGITVKVPEPRGRKAAPDGEKQPKAKAQTKAAVEPKPDEKAVPSDW